MLLKDLKNKKIAIVGFAREGRNTLLALQKLFPKKKIAVFDQKQGKDYLKTLKNFDTIFKTPGIPLSQIKPFVSRGAVITSQTEIFFDNFPGLIIGITGTKGKGTTATLIYEILKQAKLATFLGGNIGQPVFKQLLKAKPTDIFVYELSSHQLQGIRKSPQIAVFLNLFPDHLDYYKNFTEYKKAKEAICKYQTENDFFIYNSQDKTAREFAETTKAKKIAFDKIKLKVKMQLKGDFNLLNAKAAFAVANLLKVGEGQIKKTISNFKGLEHRLEYVGKYKGIDFYNDSMSTLPEVAIAALKALPQTETLICGGSDKGSDYKAMARQIIKSKVKNLIILSKKKGKGRGDNGETDETGSKLLKELVQGQTPYHLVRGLPLYQTIVGTMKEAVRIAFAKTAPGKTCLLSPGSASFNLFKDYQERGNLFKKFIKQYGQNKR